MPIMYSRRRFLTALSLAGGARLIDPPRVLAAEVPLETTTIRLAQIANLCFAPQYIADALLRAEGFTDIRYVEMVPGAPGWFSGGEVDFTMSYASNLVAAIDAGEPVTVLAGVMVGCIEVFAHEPIHGIADLKGRTVGVPDWRSSAHLLLTIMAAHVGLDPDKDIRWVTSQSLTPMELFADGKIDAFLGQPSESQDLRARHIGHVIVNTAVDRPWSQYFCCLLAGNREYVRKYPVATKRALRAILKATDLCATEPTNAAQQIVDRGFTRHYDYALQTLSENSYDKWREYDPEDSMRFYALRLYDSRLIKTNPT